MSMMSIYVASSETEAEIIKAMLRNAGIEAEISTDDGGGTLPNLTMTNGVELRVEENQAEEARLVLEEYQRGDTAIGEEQGE